MSKESTVRTRFFLYSLQFNIINAKSIDFVFEKYQLQLFIVCAQSPEETKKKKQFISRVYFIIRSQTQHIVINTIFTLTLERNSSNKHTGASLSVCVRWIRILT